MNALVTGGAGLIGSHLVDLLVEQGHQVRILDNLASPTHLNGVPDWINPAAEFIHGDLRDPATLDRALQGVDWVFHQAADGGFTSALSHYFTNNSLPTAVLYELIRDKHPVQKVVVASSQAVYGEGSYLCPRHGPQRPPPRPLQQLRARDWELRCPARVKGRPCRLPMSPLPIAEGRANPYLPYALSKYLQELLALRLGKLYRIPTVALRYALTYGPRQSLTNPTTGVCSLFSTRLLSGLPPLLYEDGLQTRDFIFVTDVARANLLVAETPAADYRVFNVGAGLPTTLLDFVAALARVYGLPARPALPGRFRLGDVRHLTTDASRLRALGWRPLIPLAAGLRRYAAWIRPYAAAGPLLPHPPS